MIKAVLFDFDHTLYDRRKTVLAAAGELRSLLSDYLHDSVTDEQFSKVFFDAETSPKNHYERGYPGIVDDMEAAGLFKVKPTPEQYLEHFYPTLSKHISMFPDAYEVLQTLKDEGYKIALLTNGKTKNQNMKLSYTKLADYVEVIIVSEAFGASKPHPKPFISLCRQLGVKTSEAVYVGDQVVTDICGARGAGLKTVWKPFTGQWPDDITPPDFVVENLSEIPEIVKNLNK